MTDMLPAAPVSPAKTQVPSLPSGWYIDTYSVLLDGALAILATDVDLSIARKPGGDLASHVARATAQIFIFDGALGKGPNFPLDAYYPSIDRFSDGSWLIVDARTGGDANARSIAPNGSEIARFMLGDGIEHVAIDEADRIWVGWFDEGVFGNDGWRLSGREWPPSSNGVGCFGADGRLLDLPDWPSDVGSIADCYALNTGRQGTWVCPYTDFPIVQFISGEPARWWRSGASGPKAIALEGSYALLAGGYQEEASLLMLVELIGPGCGEQAHRLASWNLPLRRLPPSENEWSPVWNRPDLLNGRGDTLHLIDAGLWHRWHVTDLVDAVHREE